ncbi:diketogulonate reductase-like aldo/keto reductase [Prauserella shujinwangii]|uniref:Diketogulonate reductase-like aldo/keto reductase n=1 Tax=Prauserella shujinwangii TaxID=1453103 RepID=A0A2T0LQ49_9PSEU|nr:aldo/keto reductase [Prauserella shujinwangii]PRX45451.1 diketogulonate reductase-like aldo/keto reductase [Prauserella shujinwangii]
MAEVPTITLNNGVAIPQLGFGVFQVPPDETAAAVGHALRAGYRSIDTAAAYRNEEGVGAAIRDSGIPRDELFVTTKLWNSDQGYDSTLRAFDESMRKLGLDYLDLYLIHWPLPKRDNYVDTWRAFEKLYADGRVRAIGVSNFHVSHLRRLFDETDTVPAVNQVELHPNLPQAELRAFHAEHRIATEAWSPLAQGGLLADPALGEIARKYGKTPAQVVLRWHLELGNIVIPKSVTPSRIEENIAVFDFDLDEVDLEAIRKLDNGGRVGPDPDEFDVA